MNIKTDSFEPTLHTTATSQTAQKGMAHTVTSTIAYSNTGYDIADNKVMENEAYKGHGLTAVDIMQQASDIDVETQKDFMVVMSHCVSGEDFEKMAEDGFTPGNCDPQTYVTILDKIKATLASRGVEVAGYTDTLDTETLEEITGAVTQALKIQDMSDDAVKYMVENAKAPTIENLYTAGFSTTGSLRQASGYYSDGAYYAKKADTLELDNIQESLENAVTKAGIGDGQRQSALETAKWLVESGIELNSENLINANNIRNIQFPLDEDYVTSQCVNAVINGKSPYEANLTGEKTIDEQSRELIDQVNDITDEQIHEAVENGVELNIRNLSNININEASAGSDNSTPSLKEIEARRVMEEIRLSMTQEANRRLIRQGISIDTTKLQDLVEMLKKAEKEIKETLYNGGSIETNDELDSLYNETITKTSELSDMPAAVIGPLAAKIGTYTINDVYDAGSKLEQTPDYSKTDEYEKLMTAPRRDLGDSITKAFRNVDDILTDMGLETSDSNRRAVRILGYNSMDITNENIETVKQADSQVTSCIDKMTPSTVLKMIREQKNPLTMSMDELEDYLDKNSEDSLDNSEKYSKFLQKLDRAGDITSDEREAYIGIYRLFNQIERSDGAVIGSIVASGAQMNFKNMLSAVRTSQNKNMDVAVDDGFGALQELITGTKSIDAQISEGFSGNTANDEQARNQERYYATLSGEINSELSDKTDVSKLDTGSITATTTIEGFMDMLDNIRTEDTQVLNNEAFQNYRQSINQSLLANENIIQELLDYSQPATTNNIEAAMMLSENRNELFRKIKDMSESDDILDEADDFVDNLSDGDTASEIYDKIIKSATKSLDQYIYDPATSYIDIKSAQVMYKQLSLLSSLSREENYQVPMELGGEITNVNLKIFHNKSDMGKVTVTLENDIIGKVAAEFQVDETKITGMVACENKAVENMLSNISDTLSEAFEDKKVNVSVIDSKSISLDKFGDDRDKEKSAAVSNSELFKTAKVFLKSLKNMGDIENEN